MTQETSSQNNSTDNSQNEPFICKKCDNKSAKSPAHTAPYRCSGLACIMIFMGEVICQSGQESQPWYTLSDNAVEGLGRLCLDMGYELLEIADPEALQRGKPSQP